MARHVPLVVPLAPFFAVVTRLLEIPTAAGRHDMLVACAPPPPSAAPLASTDSYDWNGVVLPGIPPELAPCIKYYPAGKVLLLTTPRTTLPTDEHCVALQCIRVEFMLEGSETEYFFRAVTPVVVPGQPEGGGFVMTPTPGGSWVCVLLGWDFSMILAAAALSNPDPIHMVVHPHNLLVAAAQHAALLAEVVFYYVQTFRPFSDRPLTVLYAPDEMCHHLKGLGVFARRAKEAADHTRLEWW